MYDLHFWPTPNGKKVTILLEELAVPYKIVPVRLGRGDQFSDEFLKISPNNRMPALVDHAPRDGGTPVSMFESGAIMLYIAEKEGRFWPQETRAKNEVMQWVMWQMANQGPKTGERGHFFNRVPPDAGDQSYARRRFGDEVHRIYGVLNNRLYDRAWITGEEYTVADMVCYPWASYWNHQGIDIEEFRYVKRWLDAMAQRPAVVKGMAVTVEQPEDLATLPPAEQERIRKLLFNQRARPAPTR
jgi:GSH-dependent disulfide-bond oxidoreductase